MSIVQTIKTFLENPLVVSNKNIENLSDATLLLLDTLEKFGKENDLSSIEVDELKDLILKSFLKKKAMYLMEEKLDSFSQYLGDSCNFALQNTKKMDDDDYKEVAYIKHTKRLLTNEHY